MSLQLSRNAALFLFVQNCSFFYFSIKWCKGKRGQTRCYYRAVLYVFHEQYIGIGETGRTRQGKAVTFDKDYRQWPYGFSRAPAVQESRIVEINAVLISRRTNAVGLFLEDLSFWGRIDRT